MLRRTFIGSSIFSILSGAAIAAGHNPNCRYRGAAGGEFIVDQSNVVYGHNFDRHAETALARAKPVTVTVETLSEYRSAYQALLEKRLPRGSIVLFDRSNDPRRSLQALDTSPTRIWLIHDIPRTTSEVMEIHTSGVSVAVAEQNRSHLDGLIDQVDSVGGLRVERLGSGSLANAYSQWLASLPNTDLVVHIGHVIPYNFLSYVSATLPFSDGSAFSVVSRSEVSLNEQVPIDTYEASSSHLVGARLWVLGCNTVDTALRDQLADGTILLTAREITYEHAVNAAMKIIDGGTVREIIARTQQWQLFQTEGVEENDSFGPGEHSPLARPAEDFIFFTSLDPDRNLSSVMVNVA